MNGHPTPSSFASCVSGSSLCRDAGSSLQFKLCGSSPCQLWVSYRMVSMEMSVMWTSRPRRRYDKRSVSPVFVLGFGSLTPPPPCSSDFVAQRPRRAREFEMSGRSRARARLDAAQSYLRGVVNSRIKTRYSSPNGKPVALLEHLCGWVCHHQYHGPRDVGSLLVRPELGLN